MLRFTDDSMIRLILNFKDLLVKNDLFVSTDFSADNSNFFVYLSKKVTYEEFLVVDTSVSTVKEETLTKQGWVVNSTSPDRKRWLLQPNA